MNQEGDDTHQKKHYHFLGLILFLAVILLATQKTADDIVPPVDVASLIPIMSELEKTQVGSLFPGDLDDPLVTDTNHIATPEIVRGIYITGWSAGNSRTMDRILKMIDETGINAVVIDIKDATGRISYQPKDEALLASGVGTKRIRDLEKLTKALHDRGVYIIGRLQVFQDPYFASMHPQETFQDTRTSSVWRDYKGIAWLRPDSRNVWNYIVDIAKDAYSQGFDEINLDYVRYPSDGALSFIDHSQRLKSREETIAEFFKYLDREIRGANIPLSADVFGLTMSLNDDLGIGQTVGAIAPYVDYLCPMIYPSHFWNGSYGIAFPAASPYEIIQRSLSDGIKKMEAINEPKEKLRPWLQDFHLVGVLYTEDKIRAQIQATYDVGLESWLMWDPKNVYTSSALKQ